MKIAVLCLFLFTIAFALPISKSRLHDSRSSEVKHSPRGHHAQKHHHSHEHSHEDRHDHSHEHVNSHESQEQQESSHPSSVSSEESEEITEQQTLLVSSDRSQEEDLSHSDVDDHDDVDDDNHSDASDPDDSDESDESHQVFTDVPTDFPVTQPFTPAPFTGRGDSPYGIRAKVDQAYWKKSKKSSGKFDSHDATEEVDSTPDEDSHESQSSKARSFESQDTSVESKDRSNLQDSVEVHSVSHSKSVENDSRQKLDSVEEDRDNSRSDISRESYGTGDNSKQLKAHSKELQWVDHDHDVDDVSNQTAESFDSIEDNKIEQ